jgi:hypothetical protein
MSTNPDNLSPEAIAAIKRGCEDSVAGRVTEADFSQHTHPDALEYGMLFRLATAGDTYMVIDVCDGTRLVQVHGSDVGAIKSSASLWGTDSASDYQYLGMASELLTLKTDKPVVALTDAMVQRAYVAYFMADGSNRDAVKHVLTLALNGKL